MKTGALHLPLLVCVAAAGVNAQNVPPGLAAFRAACRAPEAVIVTDLTSMKPYFDTDPDWPFNPDDVNTRIDQILFEIGGACDEHDQLMIEWTVVDKIVAHKSAAGTTYERPERAVPLAKLAGVKEIRFEFEPAYLERKAFIAKGGDHRDWLKQFLSRLYDKAVVAEEVKDVSFTAGMPTTVRFEAGILAIGLAPSSQFTNDMGRFFPRLFDLALSGKPTAAVPRVRPKQ